MNNQQEHLINVALQAINNVVSDGSGTLHEIIEDLKEIKDEIETWIESLNDDIDRLKEE